MFCASTRSLAISRTKAVTPYRPNQYTINDVEIVSPPNAPLLSHSISRPWHLSYVTGDYPIATVLLASPLDERLKKVKKYIVRGEKEKELKGEALLTQLSKMVLIGEYIKEAKDRRAELRKKKKKTVRWLSVNDRFSNNHSPLKR